MNSAFLWPTYLEILKDSFFRFGIIGFLSTHLKNEMNEKRHSQLCVLWEPAPCFYKIQFWNSLINSSYLSVRPTASNRAKTDGNTWMKLRMEDEGWFALEYTTRTYQPVFYAAADDDLCTCWWYVTRVQGKIIPQRHSIDLLRIWSSSNIWER